MAAKVRSINSVRAKKTAVKPRKTIELGKMTDDKWLKMGPFTVLPPGVKAAPGEPKKFIVHAHVELGGERAWAFVGYDKMSEYETARGAAISTIRNKLDALYKAIGAIRDEFDGLPTASRVEAVRDTSTTTPAPAN